MLAGLAVSNPSNSYPSKFCPFPPPPLRLPHPHPFLPRAAGACWRSRVPRTWMAGCKSTWRSAAPHNARSACPGCWSCRPHPSAQQGMPRAKARAESDMQGKPNESPGEKLTCHEMSMVPLIIAMEAHAGNAAAALGKGEKVLGRCTKGKKELSKPERPSMQARPSEITCHGRHHPRPRPPPPPASSSPSSLQGLLKLDTPHSRWPWMRLSCQTCRRCGRWGCARGRTKRPGGVGDHVGRVGSDVDEG